MKIKETPVLEELIKRGVNLGWNAAFKHIDNPSSDIVKTTIYNVVLSTISEYFMFKTKKFNTYLLFSDCVEDGVNMVNIDELEYDNFEEELKSQFSSSIMASIQQKFVLSK